MLLVAAIAGVCMTALVVVVLPNWGGQSTVATQTPSEDGQQSTIGGLGQNGGLGNGQGNGLGDGQSDGLGDGPGEGQANGLGDGQGSGQGNGLSGGQGVGEADGSGDGQNTGQADGSGNAQGTGQGNAQGVGQSGDQSDGQSGSSQTGYGQSTSDATGATVAQAGDDTTTQQPTTTSTLPPSVDTLPPRVVEIEIDYNSTDEPKPGNPDPYGDPYGDGGDASTSDYPDGDNTIGGASSSQTYSETYSWHDGESERKVRAIFNATDKGKSGSQQPAIVGAGISDDGDAEEDTVLRFIDETTGAEMWLHGGVIIKFISEWGDAEIDAFMAAHGIDESRISTLPLTNTFLISTPPGLAAVELTQQLAGLEGVDLITPDWAMPIVGQ